MINNFDDAQKVGKEGMERSLESFGAVSKGLQALASETADFSKRAFEDGASHFERLIGSKSIDAAIAAQAEFLKASYETSLGQANRLGELYVGMVKDAAKPFEGLVPTYGK